MNEMIRYIYDFDQVHLREMGLRLAPTLQLYPRVRQRFSYLPFLASILLPLESDSLYFYQLQPPFLFRRVPYLDQIVRVILAYCLSLYCFLLIIRPLDFVIMIFLPPKLKYGSLQRRAGEPTRFAKASARLSKTFFQLGLVQFHNLKSNSLIKHVNLGLQKSCIITILFLLPR